MGERKGEGEGGRKRWRGQRAFGVESRQSAPFEAGRQADENHEEQGILMNSP